MARKAVEAGGGGGGDLSGLNRENFQPVLLWQGGRARCARPRAVAVPLNDALSSFKLVAIATDGAQLFGTGSADIRTAQDLTIYRRPAAAGAHRRLCGGLHAAQRLGQADDGDRDVELYPRIAQGKPLTVTIPAGGAVPVAWNLTAPPAVGPARWKVSAQAADGKAIDQSTSTQDVIAPRCRSRSGRRRWRASAPNDADPDRAAGRRAARARLGRRAARRHARAAAGRACATI